MQVPIIKPRVIPHDLTARTAYATVDADRSGHNFIRVFHKDHLSAVDFLRQFSCHICGKVGATVTPVKIPSAELAPVTASII